MDKIKTLLQKAANDFKAVDILLANQEAPASIIAFHIQQGIEKLIKALLISAEISYKHTHDLDYLLDRALTKFPALSSFYDTAEQLSPHAVLSRYEEGVDLTCQEVGNLYKNSVEIKNTVLGLIKK